ncbi:7752_t:CDS:2, partial [Dentiscutata heterogama]
SLTDFFKYFGKWENGKILFGTAFTWFALDVAFYGIGLNNNSILKQIGYIGDGSDPYESLYKASVGNIIIALLGTVPGYWVTVFTIDLWGRRPIQLMGFGLLKTLFIVLGFVFPTRYRSTGHGISAASGKLGAIISQVGFIKLKDIGGLPGSNTFIDHLFKIFAVFMFAGLIVTFFFVPETKNKSLEDLSNENQEGFINDNRPADVIKDNRPADV